jgi:hypothetical protein
LEVPCCAYIYSLVDGFWKCKGERLGRNLVSQGEALGPKRFNILTTGIAIAECIAVTIFQSFVAF